MNYIFIVRSYDSNAILTEVLPNRQGSVITTAWQKVQNKLKDNRLFFVHLSRQLLLVRSGYQLKQYFVTNILSPFLIYHLKERRWA